MPLKSFPLNTSRSFIISALFAFSLSHCASESKLVAQAEDPQAVAEAPVVMETYNKIHIVNHTQDFVDTVRFKPCGAPTKLYTTLTSSIKPQEKIVMNVHELCIDVVAEDGFRQTVYEQSNINLSQRTTLDIK